MNKKLITQVGTAYLMTHRKEIAKSILQKASQTALDLLRNHPLVRVIGVGTRMMGITKFTPKQRKGLMLYSYMVLGIFVPTIFRMFKKRQRLA